MIKDVLERGAIMTIILPLRRLSILCMTPPKILPPRRTPPPSLEDQRQLLVKVTARASPEPLTQMAQMAQMAQK